MVDSDEHLRFVAHTVHYDPTQVFDSALFLLAGWLLMPIWR